MRRFPLLFQSCLTQNSDLPGCRVEVEGLDIHFKRWGKGPPVVLVHGGGNDWHEWKKNIPSIAPEFEVIALDLPGFGLSQSPDTPISFSWSVDFLKRFLAELGISRTHLIGHSMGAMISIAFAARYPECVNKLVIIDSSGIGRISRKGRLLLNLFRTLDKWSGQKRGPKYVAGRMEEFLVRDLLPEIKSPVLIVWGSKDLYLPVSHSRTAQELIPDARLYIFPGCGHAPQRECAEEFNNLVLRFLSNA